MAIYLVLVILFGLAILICGGICVYAVIMKQKRTIKLCLLAILISMFGCIYCGGVYAKKTVEYVNSDEFQKDTKNITSKVTETGGSIVSGASEGLSKGLDDDAIVKLASKGGNIIAKSIKTIAGAMDSTIVSKHIFIDKIIENAGFELGRADENYANTLRIYIAYNKDFIGKLKLVAFDVEGKKMDVAEVEVNVKANQEKVEKFEFKNGDLGITTYYVLSKV